MKNIFLTAGLVLISALGLLAQDCATGFCPTSVTTHHRAGAVSPQTVDITYGVVSTTLFTGTKCAITRNLGATTQATAANDATAASAGWYWQFNRKQGYSHDGTTRTPSTVWDNTVYTESSDWLLTNDPCRLLLGGTWRLPTNGEWTYADGASAGNWTTYTNAYTSVLKLHAGGSLDVNSSALDPRGSYGNFWSSTQSGAANASVLNLSSSNSSMNNPGKTFGFSVRCLSDL